MHTVAFFQGFAEDASEAGLSDDEIETLVTFLSENPMAGVAIQGTGGCRKFRISGRGKGKSGGYRVVTFYSGDNIPVFLITVFSKGERSDLTKSERNALRDITRALKDSYQSEIAVLAKKGA